MVCFSNGFNLPAKLHSPQSKLRLHHLTTSRATTYLQLNSDELADTDWDLAVSEYIYSNHFFSSTKSHLTCVQLEVALWEYRPPY